HSSHSEASFNELRLEGKFCDAIIQVQDVEFPVHRVVLCDCSSYFQALFKHWMTTHKKVFNIPGLTPEIMQLIIDFAYTGSVNVTEGNIQDLMLVADMLNVMDLMQACSSILCEQLRPENCIGIWQFTKVCTSSELQEKAYRYIIDHFEAVASSNELLEFSVQELTEILSRDDLNVRMERIVFEAIVHWIDHKPEEREEHITALLSTVRLALTSLAYIRSTVSTNPLVSRNSECNKITDDALKTIWHKLRNSPRPGLSNPYARPRLPTAIMLVSGGWSGDPTGEIEAYDPRSDVWTSLPTNLDHPRSYHGTVFLNGYFYCIGGFDRVQHFSNVSKLDVRTHTWYEVAPMHNRRCYVSVTELNGSIYAMGGYDGQYRLSSAERYTPETNQWTRIARMHDQRSDANCATLHEKIYICGGFNGLECLQSAECYNPETNQWTMIAAMMTRRSGIGVVAFKEQIYAIGGFDGNERQRSAEIYDPWTNLWRAVSPMLSPRSNFGLQVIEDRIFAVGGFNGFHTTNEVESYYPSTDSWAECRSMEISRSALSCCVLCEIPNMGDYTFSRDDLPRLDFEDRMEEYLSDS
uniref:BTB domain-containing protein n=1 Tax=Scophthalmus maximus TaxID=52904 RepID=A0A8D3ACN1_SCOMX